MGGHATEDRVRSRPAVGLERPPASFEAKEKKEGRVIVRGEVFTEAKPESLQKKEPCEDTVGVWSELGLSLLADGMGGNGHGEVISREAKAAINKVVSQIKPGAEIFIGKDASDKGITWKEKPTPEEADYLLEFLFRRAAVACRSKSEEFGTPEQMPSTTLTLGMMINTTEGPRWFVKSVGDSPVYLRKKSGRVIPIDHNYGLPADSSLEDELKNQTGTYVDITRQEVDWISQARSPESFLNILAAEGRCTEDQKKELTANYSNLVYYSDKNRSGDEKEKALWSLWREFNIFYGRLKVPGRTARNGVSQSLGSTGLSELNIHSATENGIPGVAIEAGDAGFLVSDGVSDTQTDLEIAMALARPRTLVEQVKDLVAETKLARQDVKNFRKKDDDVGIAATEFSEIAEVNLRNEDKPEGIRLTLEIEKKVPKTVVPEAVSESGQPSEPEEEAPEFYFEERAQITLAAPNAGKWQVLRRWVDPNQGEMYELGKNSRIPFFPKKRLILPQTAIVK